MSYPLPPVRSRPASLPIDRTKRRADGKPWLHSQSAVWTACDALCSCSACWCCRPRRALPILRSKTAQLLELDAVAVASDWAHYLVRTTPEFLLILAGELPSPSTLAAYRYAERLSRVRSFEIFDRRGTSRMSFVGGQPVEGKAASVPLATLAGSTVSPLVAKEQGTGELARVTLPLK